MLRFLQTFFDIALWRKGPQDLPASGSLACAVLLAYVALELIEIRMFDRDLRSAAILVGVDVLMMSAWLWLVLAFFGRRQRFVQTITATLGVGVLILMVNILVRAAQLAAGLSDSLANNWLLLRFFILALVMGRIFMHALDRGMATGIGLTIAIIYSTDEVTVLMLHNLRH